MISYNVWSNSCIAIVSIALVEFGFAIVWEEKQKKNVNIEQDKKKNRFCYKYSSSCNLIDAYSRLLFPLAFSLFIVLYVLYVSLRA